MSALRPISLLPVLATLLVGTQAFAGSPAPGGEGAPFSHQLWSAVLGRFVDSEGRVDYRALAQDRSQFDAYVAAIEEVAPSSHPELFPTTNHRLAYYINAYNALVIKGVLDRGPEEKSVWRGGIISGYSFFVGMKVTLGGTRTHLKELEDETLRQEFQDPRIHAALNCASIGCPRLPQKAFDPRRLDSELDAAMRELVEDKRHVRFLEAAGRPTVYLSRIFDWFRKDFLAYEESQNNPHPNLIDYVNRYRKAASQIPRHSKVKFLKYDKGINQQ